MADADSYQPTWDATNQRFERPSRCPYPDCAQEVDPTNLRAAIAWCPSCRRPYEATRISLSETTAQIELNRRPHSAFCTYTGQVLSGYSRLDWCEAGGGPGRSNSVDDARGAIFGTPSKRRRVEIVEDEAWIRAARRSELSQPDSEDRVAAISVVRGRTVVVTARGRVGVFDAETGEPGEHRPLDWPDGSTDPGTDDRSVRHPPAFRGTRMVVATAHQAQFRDLKPILFDGAAADSRPRLEKPEPGARFIGPPLGVDFDDRVAFCLLQGRAKDRRIKDARLRFYTPEGDEIASCRCQNIARPPVFDRNSGHLAWIETGGAVCALPVAGIGGAASLEPLRALPETPFELETSDLPTLIAATDTRTPPRTELWFSSGLDGQVVLYRCRLDEVLQDPGSQWYAENRVLGKLGTVNGLAVGIGSRYHDENPAGQMVGVSTDQQAARFQRFSTIAATYPMQGHDGTGSYDPPIACSAGVVARLRGRISLDNKEAGWNEDGDLHPSAPVSGSYDRPQGIAMFGRRIYIGHYERRRVGVLCYRLELEAVGDD